MKHFLYTIVEQGSRDGSGTRRQLRLYVVKRGIPVFLTRYNYTFESEAQACYNAIEKAKALPRSALDARHPAGGRDHSVLGTFCTIHNLSHTAIEKPWK